MSQLVEFQRLLPDHLGRTGSVLLAPSQIISVNEGQPESAATGIVTTESVMGSSVTVWVKESYPEVKAKLLGAPCDLLELMAGSGLDQYAVIVYNLQRNSTETDADYRERCRQKGRGLPG